METIGQRIRRLRKERNLLQDELAPLCGLKQGTLSLVESKNHEFSATVLYGLANALGVSTDEIMFGEQGETMGQSEIIRIFSELSPEQRNTVLIMMRGFHAVAKANIGIA